MKATCPNCSTSYKVADDKVPDVGAQIKCPKCSTTFVVRRDQGQAQPPAAPAAQPLPPPPKPAAVPAAPAPPATQPPPAPRPAQPPPAAPHQQATPLDALAGQNANPAAVSQPPAQAPAQPPAPPAAPAKDESVTPNLDALDGEAFISSATQAEIRASEATRDAAKGMSAIRAQSRTAARSGLEGFRVRTARGLTYDFPSRQAMDRWLSEREDLEGCEAAEPGGEWKPASEMLKAPTPLHPPDGPEAKPTGPIDPSRPVEVSPARPAVVLPPGQVGQAAAPDQAVRVAQRAYPGPRAGLVVWSLLVIGFLGILAGAAVTVTRYGILDLTPYLPLDRIGITAPPPGAGQGGEVVLEAPELPPEGDPEARFRKAVGAGRLALRSKRYSVAALEYNRALAVHPGSVEALEGLAKSFGGLGDRDRALDALKKARAIKHE